MMRYIVARPLKVGDRTAQPGEELPEAARWPNVKSYISGGYIVAAPEVADQSERIARLEADVAALQQELGVSADAGETGDTPDTNGTDDDASGDAGVSDDAESDGNAEPPTDGSGADTTTAPASDDDQQGAGGDANIGTASKPDGGKARSAKRGSKKGT